MRVVYVAKDCPHLGLIANKSYVMAEATEAELPVPGTSYPIETYKGYKPYTGEDLTGKRILLWRSGGIGDVLFLTPALAVLKKRFNCFIRFASSCLEPLVGNHDIDELQYIPFDTDLLKDCDYHLMFQGVLESSNLAARTIPAVDLHLTRAFIDPATVPAVEKLPRLFYLPDELAWAREEIKKLGITEQHKVVGIALGTSMPRRDYPLDKLSVVIKGLINDTTVRIVLAGSKEQHVSASYVKEACGDSVGGPVIEATQYDLRKSLVLAARYNLIISSDTWLVQVALALHRPVIGLYGPFTSRLRMSYGINAIGLDAKTPCSPCFSHDPRECILGYPSPCFTVIEPQMIITEAKKFL